MFFFFCCRCSCSQNDTWPCGWWPKKPTLPLPRHYKQVMWTSVWTARRRLPPLFSYANNPDSLHPCHVSSPGVFWTLTLRSFAPSRCLTSTSTPALYAANTFKVGPPRGVGKETVVVPVVILRVFACRSRTEIPRLHSQRAVYPPRLPQSTHAQVLLSARQLWDHWLFARRHYGKLKWSVPELWHWFVKLNLSAGVRTFWKPNNQMLNNILSHRKILS